MGQTYPNFEAILINDGSTDSSEEICLRYAALDSRFRVVSIPNGGVNNARNIGVSYATGYYLAFVDSDDRATFDMLETMLHEAERFMKDLVICSALLTNLNDSASTGIIMSTQYVGEELVLSSEKLAKERMRLIWNTPLLESVWAKLYKLDLWNQLGLRFPADQSPQEDFRTNMRYFEACNGAVFFNKVVYYYHNEGSFDPLTHRYRPDLFQKKMFLMEQLRIHLGDWDQLLPEEKNSFYEYVASTGLLCAEEIILSTVQMAQVEREAKLTEIVNDPLFRESCEKAANIDDRFTMALHDIAERNVDGLYNSIRATHDHSGTIQETAQEIAHETTQEATQEVTQIVTQELAQETTQVTTQEVAQETTKDTAQEVTAEDEPAPDKLNPGILNRGVRKTLRTLKRLLAKTTAAKKLDRLEKKIYSLGLKQTLKSMNEKPLETQMKNLNRQAQRLGDNQRSMERHFSDNQRSMERFFNDSQRAIERLFNDSQCAMETRFYDSQRAMEMRNNEAQDGRIWQLERRLEKNFLDVTVNEYRQRKKALMLGTAEHNNIGDAAITVAEQKILREQFPDYFQVEISTYELKDKYTYLKAICNEDDIFFINGGGNLGSLYPPEEELHRRIVADFPNNKIVIFPQTIDFESSAVGIQQLEISARVYNAHEDLTLFVRGKQSLNFARRHFPNVRVILMPDAVFCLQRDYHFKRSGALLCLREDKEGILSRGDIEQIKDRVIIAVGVANLEQTTNIAKEEIPRNIRNAVVDEELRRFASHSLVVTDRLHGMIFAAITGTPCVVYRSFDQKIIEFYEAFFADSNAVFYISGDLNELETALRNAKVVRQPCYPVFEKRSLAQFRDYVFGDVSEEAQPL